MIGFRKNLGLIFGVCGVVLFGGTFPATRLTVAAIDPLLLTAARASIAVIAGITVLLMLRRWTPPPELWAELLLAGLCIIVGFPVFTALAMVIVPAAHGGVVLGILPLATAAAAAIVAHDPEHRILARQSRGWGHRRPLCLARPRSTHLCAHRSVSVRNRARRRVWLRFVRMLERAHARLGGGVVAGCKLSADFCPGHLCALAA
jgi:hypothetical protein